MVGSLETKDSCPVPELYWSSKPFSIMMETSQLDTLELDSRGPSSLLSLLKAQYPEGIAISERSSRIKSYMKPSSSVTKKYWEITFKDEASLKQAMSRKFQIQNQTIKYGKTLKKLNGEAYQFHIRDIEQLGNPLAYREDLLKVLNRYGSVQALHLHYTKEANWFTGEGCAIWIGNFDKSIQAFGFEDKLKARFSYTIYPVLDTDEIRAKTIYNKMKTSLADITT